MFYDTSSTGESNPFGDLMKNMMTAGAEFGQQLVKNNPELANLQSNMMDQDQNNDEFSEAKVGTHCSYDLLNTPPASLYPALLFMAITPRSFQNFNLT